MEQSSSSSKVTVEYFDPDGVYQLLSPGLLPRLPLRNLHWESHSGPTRSISSLHIDLAPNSREFPPSSATTDTPSASTTSLSRAKSTDSAASGDDGFRTQAVGQVTTGRPESLSGASKVVVKERRHQIPGLRQTPYLKVLFLRCDDNETYKNQARRQVREWIKDHTPPAQRTTKLNAQENHDAFEWLIIHVIVPNTAAATQPRTGGKGSEGSNGTSSEKSRWRGGGSNTIFEKLRADFSADRVAQIRIGINDVPYEMLPRVVPAIPGSYTESPQENENAWLDLVTKFKSLILASFDMRVSQYEEDIREKDAQRSLPGWNFCTFFVLKEGLARGFESVGLVEDALVGYDELAVGLDAIIREQSTTGSNAEHGGSFLPFTEDLRRQAELARSALLKDIGTIDTPETEEPIDLQSTTAPAENDMAEIPLNATKKRYRDLILSNDISIFDFRCYLFARQLSLLLRLANAWSSQEELLAKLREQRESSLQGVAARLPPSVPSDDTENLAVLGEVCRRTMDFVASIARIMREDLWTSWVETRRKQDSKVDDTLPSRLDPVMTQVVDNIVSSFTFAIAQQILAQTSTKSLPIPPSTLAPPSSKIGLDGQEQKAAIPEPKTMMHPARSSSLAIRSRSREPLSPGLFPGGRRSSLPEQGAVLPFLKPGLEELASYRGELYTLSRDVLEQAAKQRGWSIGWAEMAGLQSSNGTQMEEVDLNSNNSEKSEKTDPILKLAPSSHGVGSQLLRAALDSQDDFHRLYETLTDKALRHYTVANHIQSVQSSMADLAVLKYHLKDYAASASYLYRLAIFRDEGGWAQIEVPMLLMYSKCLEELQRKDDYVKIVMKLLAKAAMMEKERLAHKSALKLGFRNHSDDLTQISSCLPKLLEVVKDLQHDIHVPLQSIFSHVEVDSTVRYHPEQDSFGVQLRFSYLLEAELSIDKAKVRISPIAGDINRDIWLESDGPIIFNRGKVTLLLQSNVIIPGTYVVSHVCLQTSKLTLQYEHNSSVPTLSKRDTFLTSPKLLIYPRAEAFDVKLSASRHMHLDRHRSLQIEISSGWNNVTAGEFHVRAATAGLRLQTSESKVVEGSLEISKKTEAGVVRFGAMGSNSKAKIHMPFNLENEVNDISIKLEVSYTTEKGNFFFAATPIISIMLPLGVNVQDVFKHKRLFSKFTISSATSSPLRLLRSQLNGSEVFSAKGGLGISKPVTVFPRQPASMLYQITRSSASLENQRPPSRKPQKSSLSLILHYICLEEEIEKVVTMDLEGHFRAGSLHPYMRLIIPAVITELRIRLTSYDLERIALLNELSTSVLSSVKWQDHFLGLGRMPDQQEIVTLLGDALQAWQQEKAAITLMPISIDDDTIANSRSITIPVDVPSVTVVHTADIRLLEVSSVGSNSSVGALNQPISSSLTIKWTRIWDTETPLGKSADIDLEDHEFFYEISGAADTWLIGGRRKGHFKVPSKIQSQESNNKLSFPVVLIPLREGSLPYPSVDIKPAPHAKSHSSGSLAAKDPIHANHPIITCETDYKNSGETIRVINNARKTTVSLDASGPQGGAWLLESESRSLENGRGVIG